MDSSLASWLVVAIALAAANLPFLTERVFGFIPVKSNAPGNGDVSSPLRTKSFPLRLLELIVLYFVVGFLARALESRIGGVFAQGWEFYAVTGCLFLVLAFPGFVFRYLRRQRG
ncbi:DUF2818 family protein [Massilia sp. G4R7]|uniref:DUF2818 family protein n=1 Tax=Massilia phyllostachyos TaxID=2898585 RepID=A0ABS8QCQ0_9BURK|nr:DUF2818 family protein [Massilia phyllostachyos]MCD2518701.1 DUF2818 family protein [Massilia phyllostachyos]